MLWIFIQQQIVIFFIKEQDNLTEKINTSKCIEFNWILIKMVLVQHEETVTCNIIFFVY